MKLKSQSNHMLEYLLLSRAHCKLFLVLKRGVFSPFYGRKLENGYKIRIKTVLSCLFSSGRATQHLKRPISKQMNREI